MCAHDFTLFPSSNNITYILRLVAVIEVLGNLYETKKWCRKVFDIDECGFRMFQFFGNFPQISTIYIRLSKAKWLRCYSNQDVFIVDDDPVQFYNYVIIVNEEAIHCDLDGRFSALLFRIIEPSRMGGVRAPFCGNWCEYFYGIS